MPRKCEWGNQPWREMAWMLSTQPSARSEMITSTVVSPVPARQCSRLGRGVVAPRAATGRPSRPGARPRFPIPAGQSAARYLSPKPRGPPLKSESARRITAVPPVGSMSMPRPRQTLWRSGHAARALQMMVHYGAQIVAVHHAWNEALAQLDFRQGVELRASAQPSQEMIRLIPESGHIPRGNV